MSRRTVAHQSPAPGGGKARVPKPGKARAGVWQAGNRAAAEVIGRMERSVGEDLSGVEVHSGTAASELAGALGAAAFTRGDQIFLSASAPPLSSDGGRRLLAHELAHVVQQRRASTVDTPAIGEAGDSFEQAADRTAHLAMRGQTASVPSGGTAPGVQREEAGAPKKDPVYGDRAKVEEALRTFLEKDAPKNLAGNVDLNKVGTQLVQLAQAPPVPPRADKRAETSMAVAALISSPAAPTQPGPLAKAVAAILPSPFPMAFLRRGLHVAATGPSKSDAEKVQEKLAAGPDKSGAGPLTVAASPGPGDRSPYGEFVAGKAGTAPTIIPGPVSDILQLIKGDDKPKPKAKPEAGLPQKDEVKPDGKPAAAAEKPDVVSGADRAAAPVESKESPQPGLGALPAYVDSAIREAEASRQTTATLALAESMKPQQEVVFQQVEHLLQKNAMAKGKVTAVNVTFGGKLAKTIRLGGGR